MNTAKVLWIEDDADNHLYDLTGPVYIDGRYQLDIAISASEAFFYLNERPYEVVIVDIRIPPGKDPEWRERHDHLIKRNDGNSNRLGLELLKCIFEKNGSQPGLKISQNLSPKRYGVFTVEMQEELTSDLEKLELSDVKYKRKNAMMPHTALLDFILEVSETK